MSNIGDKLRGFREAANLTIEQMALFLPIPPDDLVAVEEGDTSPSLTLLKEYAQIAGVELNALLTQPLLNTPPTLLFRSMPDRELSVEEIANTGTHLILGEFLRASGRVLELRTTLNRRANLTWLEEDWAQTAKPDALHDLSRPEALFEAARFASGWLREALSLGDAPISSMRELLQTLDVAVFFIDPDDLDRNIEGASTLSPTPSILTNLIGGAESWWRTRMTLAHELGHLLLDLPSQRAQGEAPLMLSPVVRPRSGTLPRPWQLLPAHEAIERRANAFAAYLLAPEEAIRELIGPNDPTTGDSIASTAKHFGLGRIAAINVLTYAFGLSDQARYDMLHNTRTPPWSFEERFAGDRQPIEVGLYGGDLQRLTLEALGAGHIDRVQARRVLNIPTTEPLPDASTLTPSHTAPLRPHDDLVRRAVERAHPGLYGGDVSKGPGGWRVELLELDAQREPHPIGFARVSFDLQVESIER